MEIVINGKNANTNARTINEIIEKREIDKRGLVIEYNGEILKQEKWSKKVQEGDKLELLSFVGGG